MNPTNPANPSPGLPPAPRPALPPAETVLGRFAVLYGIGVGAVVHLLGMLISIVSAGGFDGGYWLAVWLFASIAANVILFVAGLVLVAINRTRALGGGVLISIALSVIVGGGVCVSLIAGAY